jgi:hypothetical protein
MISKKYLFSAILGLGIFALAIYCRDELLNALYGVQIPWVAAGFVCLLLNYCFRAMRLNVLTGNNLPVWPQGFYCTSMHGFANYMLPLRSGDLSLPLLLKSIIDMDLKIGATVLYKARLLEVFILGMWLVVASLYPSANLPAPVRVVMMVSGILMILSPVLLRKLFDLSLIPPGKLKRAAQILSRTSTLNSREILLTCGIWTSIAMGIWCITAAIQLNISVMNIVLLIALQMVMQLAPVQGFANTGNHEGSWVAALVLMNVPAESALKFALSSHVIVLMYVLTIGLMALFLRHAFIR